MAFFRKNRELLVSVRFRELSRDVSMASEDGGYGWLYSGPMAPPGYSTEDVLLFI